MTASTDLRRAAIQGLVWGFGGKILTILTSFGVLMVTSRHLSAADFGTFAAGMIFADFSWALASSTVGVALVQKADLTPQEAGAGLGLFAALGLMLAGCMAGFAGLFAQVFDAPGLPPVLLAMALPVLARVLAGFTGAMLQRSLDMRYYQLTQNVPQVLAGGLTISFVIAGAGAMGLVIGYSVAAVLELALGVLRIRPSLAWPRSIDAFRQLLSVGMATAANRLANFGATNIDRFMVGAILGPAALGIYTRAYSLMMIPVKVLGMAINSTFLAVFARMQKDEQRLALVLRRILEFQPLVFIPAGIALILVLPDMVPLILGKGWKEAVLPAQLLCGVLMARMGYIAPETAAIAIGEAWRAAGRQIAYASAVVALGGAGSAWGVGGVAAGVATALCLFYLLSIRRLAVRLGCPTGPIARGHLRALALSALALLVAWPVLALVPAEPSLLGTLRHLLNGLAFTLVAALATVLAPASWLGPDLAPLRARLFRPILGLLRRTEP